MMNNSTNVTNITTRSPNSSVIRGQTDAEEIPVSASVIINIVLSVVSVLVNSFVAFLFYYKRALLSKPSNRLLLSLSICDLLAGIGVVFHVLITVLPAFYRDDCSYCLPLRVVIDVYTTFLVEAAVIHLCMITADRFLSLHFALRYRDVVTRSTINRCIVVTWVIPCASSTIQLCYLYPLLGPNPTDADFDLIVKAEPYYSAISFTIYMAIPFLLNGIAYISMFLEIRKLLLKTPSRRLRQASGVSSQQRRVIYIFGLMYLCFVKLTMPYFTLRLILDLNGEVEIDMLFLNIFYTCKTATLLINPFLYTVMNREFRSAAGLWARRRRNELSCKVTIAHCYFQTSMRRRSLRSSVSEQGRSSVSEQGRTYDSGIDERRTSDTLMSNAAVVSHKSDTVLVAAEAKLDSILDECHF